MNSSNMNYISVSSPHTFNMNRIHVPPKVLMPPVFHPPRWEMERSSSSSPGGSQESESESLAEERQYQLGLQQRILENEELLEPGDILGSDSLEEDSLEEMSWEEKAEYDTSAKGKQKSSGSGRKKTPVDKYSSLRYNPDWKNTKKGAEFFKALKTSRVSGGSSGDFSPEFYLHSDGSSEENQQEAKSQDSEFGPIAFTFPGVNVVVRNDPQAKKREPADGCHSKDNPGRASPPQTQQNPPQRAKKNFVKKNKRTLGLQSEKRSSYLELHNKKQQVLHGQVTDPTPIDEEPLQSVPAFQTGKMQPEWNPKGQQLKEQHKFSSRNKMESDQTVNGRAFPRNDDQQAPGGAAEPKAWSHSPGSADQDRNPGSSLGPDKPKTCFNHSPDSTHPDFPTSAYPFPPVVGNLDQGEVFHPSKESSKYQRGSPRGIPREEFHPTNLIPSWDHSAGAQPKFLQAQPKLRNNSPYFSAAFEGRVKDQAPRQDFKNHIHEDNSSPTSSCGRLAEKMEQHHPGISYFRDDDFAARWLWSLLPPCLSQLQGSSQGHPWAAGEIPEKMKRSSSEGSLLQSRKQNQPKGSKKLCSSKFYINMNMKLGGLGPDYEAIKEKQQKLKLQKEYSRQIKEYNMKNITLMQKLPTKPQVSPVARQKALEYAKKIPRPKTFITRQPEQEGKEEKAPSRPSLPQIPSLETLWSRHEKEKEVVAAFKSLHIL